MARFYHVSPIDHAIGVVLQPGRHGTIHNRFVKGGRLAPTHHKEFYELTWEAVLETARLLVNPDLPSRLDCIFASSTLVAARAFRDTFRKDGHIFEIEARDNSATFFGDIDGISNTNDGETFLHIWTSAAVRYWKDQPPGVTEVLIGGPVTIISKA